MPNNDHAYENVPRLVYGSGEYDGATFVPVCERCGRFVKADKWMRFQSGTISKKTNARCSRCGRTHMLFEGFIG